MGSLGTVNLLLPGTVSPVMVNRATVSRQVMGSRQGMVSLGMVSQVMGSRLVMVSLVMASLVIRLLRGMVSLVMASPGTALLRLVGTVMDTALRRRRDLRLLRLLPRSLRAAAGRRASTRLISSSAA
jgi:hypothetical protein